MRVATDFVRANEQAAAFYGRIGCEAASIKICRTPLLDIRTLFHQKLMCIDVRK